MNRDTIPTITQFVERREYLGLACSPAQRALLKAMYGLPLNDEEHALFRECTGRETYDPPSGGWRDVTVIAGRRSGKDSRIACPVAVYEAIYGGWTKYVSRGERVVIPIIAQNLDGTRNAYKYIRDYIEGSPRIHAWADDTKTKAMQVRNAVAGGEEPAREVEVFLECFPCSASALRGASVPCAIMDEVAFFRIEGGREKDREIQRALKPAGGTFREYRRLIKITTPYAKDGLVYDEFKRFWGVAHPRKLVWRADTLTMHPGFDAGVIDEETADDAESARVEFGANFRADVETLLPMELIERCVVGGRSELGPQAGYRYVAAVDPTGGTGRDAFTLAVVHLEVVQGQYGLVQDVMRGWRASPGQALDLAGVCAEIRDVVRPYGIWQLMGDPYAGDWPKQAFRDVGLSYEYAEHDKSMAFQELQPVIARGEIALLDHAELIRELGNLEQKKTPKEKKPTIGHPRGGHDDYANALAHAVAKLAPERHRAYGVTVRQLAPSVATSATPDSPAELLARSGRGRWGLWGGRERTRLRMFR